ncbi:MAG: NAD(P)-dependent oxidoreductase [Cellulomonadaceae bacterium]|nr:NAD(P)-dependent oxidoreductase [Cellulomonadaceae bacterium]
MSRHFADAPAVKAAADQRWMVVGSGGMFGHELLAAATEAGINVSGIDYPDIDITRAVQTEALLTGYDVIVNCASAGGIDAAEEDNSKTFAVNATGAANLATAAASQRALLVHLSSQLVFPGDATDPIVEATPIDPISAYGRTKAAAEWAVRANNPRHLIVRTAWPYSGRGQNFVTSIADFAIEQRQVALDNQGKRKRKQQELSTISIANDQFGAPTWANDVADLVVRLVLAQAPSGLYHATAGGSTTWYDFARTIVASVNSPLEILPAPYADLPPTEAKRPMYSVLAHDSIIAAGVAPIGDWQSRWEVAAPHIIPDLRNPA